MTLAIFKAHLKLALRSPWPWVITGAVSLLCWLVGRRAAGLLAAVYVLQQVGLPLLCMGLMLATVSLARLERSHRADELFRALPHNPLAWVAGRFAALYVTWLAAATLVWTVTLLAMRGPAPLGLVVRSWLAIVPVTLLFATGVPMALGHFLRRGFAAYAVTLVIFVLCSFSGLQGLSELNMGLLGSGPATNADFTLTAYFPMSQAGFFPNGALLLFNRIGAAAWGIGAMAFIAWSIARQRRDPHRRRIAVVWVTALAAVAFAAISARDIGLSRLEAMANEEAMHGQPRIAQAIQGAVPVPAVSSYRVKLSLDGEKSWLYGEAKLDLPAPGDTATVTLNQIFNVGDVLTPDGNQAPFSRQGDLLVFRTGGKAGTYTVRYNGRVEQWRRDNWNGLRLAAHITPESVMLPVSLGWYPIPGQHQLAFREFPVVEDAGVVHAPVPFHLDVSGPENLSFVSNADGGGQIRAAWVIGTPWAPTTQDGIDFFVSPDNQRAAGMFGYFSEQVAFYRNIMPLSRPLAVVEVPDSLYAVQGMVPPSGFPGAMVVSGAEFARQDGMVMNAFLTNAWWTNSRTEEERQVRDVLRIFMVELYKRSKNQRGEVFMTVFTPMQRPFGANTAQGKRLLEGLRRFSDQQGVDATGRLMGELYQSDEPLTWSRALGRVGP